MNYFERTSINLEMVFLGQHTILSLVTLSGYLRHAVGLLQHIVGDIIGCYVVYHGHQQVFPESSNMILYDPGPVEML